MPVREALERAVSAQPREVAVVVSELNLRVEGEVDLLALLDRAARVAADVVPGADHVSVTAQLGPQPFTAASTHPRALQFDEHQYDLGDGPCLQAMRGTEIVMMDRDEVSSRWPTLGEAATQAGGIRSFLSSPVSHQRTPPTGSLNVYGLAAGAFTLISRDLVLIVCAYVARAMAEYTALMTADTQVRQLREAMRSRASIEQVKGILMAVHRISSDEAFARLREQSQRTNVKLSVIAHQFLATHAVPSADGAAELLETESARDFHSAFDHAPIGMAITDPYGRLLSVNPALTRLLGRSAVELVGTNLVDATHPEDAAQAKAACVQLRGQRQPTIEQELRLMRSDGVPFPAVVSTAKVLDGAGTAAHLVMHIQDVTMQRDAMEALRETAMHDSLTGLSNRALLMDRLDQAVARHWRDSSPVSVLFVDLDGFKGINDTHGHLVGDALLVAVGQLLAEHVRPADTVARVGGDEFVVVCEDTDGATAAAIAERICAALETPLQLGDIRVLASASIGTVTMGEPSAGTATDLLRDADRAMYQVKRGRSGG